MPIYEYKCKKCSRLTSALVRNPDRETPPACQHCGATTARALSRFAVGRSASSVKESFGRPSRSAEEYSDPRQIGRWVEEKFDGYGMDLPDEAKHMIEAARDGELPDSVKDL